MPYVFYDKPCVFFRRAEKTSRRGEFFVGDAGKVPSDAEAFLLDAVVAFRERRMKKKGAGKKWILGELSEKNKGKA